MFHLPALWYFDTAVICPHRFRSQICFNTHMFCIAAIFVKYCYKTVSCYNVWINSCCSCCSPLGEKSLWNGTILKRLCWLIYWPFRAELPSCDCHRSSLRASQHCFVWWLGAVRQQAITWSNVDHDHHGHVKSLGTNMLMINSLSLKDAMIWQWFWLTLVEVMVWLLRAPSHYLKKIIALPSLTVKRRHLNAFYEEMFLMVIVV